MFWEEHWIWPAYAIQRRGIRRKMGGTLDVAIKPLTQPKNCTPDSGCTVSGGTLDMARRKDDLVAQDPRKNP
uniref:Transposase n=1 Tax=Panagrellus redivivus TaxID=6233 RepID=A0A7E4W340_PANRE